MVDCVNCDSSIEDDAYEVFEAELWDCPKSLSSWTARFCSEDCQNSFMNEAEFCYPCCDRCERNVCLRNPGNGYDMQFTTLRVDEDEDEDMYVCDACYEEVVLEHGQVLRDFEDDSIHGTGMYCNMADMADWGYIPHRRYPINYPINDAAAHNAMARRFINAGARVVADPDPGFLCGGHSTLYVNVDDCVSKASEALEKALRSRLGRDMAGLLKEAVRQLDKADWVSAIAEAEEIPLKRIK